MKKVFIIFCFNFISYCYGQNKFHLDTNCQTVGVDSSFQIILNDYPTTCFDITYCGGELKNRKCYYDSTNVIALECLFIKNKLNGQYLQYYNNGSLFKMDNYILGTKIGLSIEYYPDKTLKIIGKYLIPDTIETSNNNGNLKIIERYINDWTYSIASIDYSKKDGKWIYFYPNGKIEHIAYYNIGNAIKTWIYYDSEGKITNEIFFSN